MKKKLPILILLLLTVITFVIPMPDPGIRLRLQFDEIEGDFLRLYYTTRYSSQMDEDKVLVADYDKEHKTATFTLSPKLVKEIDCMRIDFPNIPQLLSVKDVSVSSAGMVTHRFNPSRFFDEKNIILRNDIDEISASPALGMAYFKIGEGSPYIVLSNPLLNRILFYRSRYLIPRMLFCFLIWLGYFLYRKNIFSRKKVQEV